MPSTFTSKSNRRKPKKCKSVRKRKQQWQQKKNWLDLPYDVMANIIYRVGVFDILDNAQKVCTSWRNICKDPAMWRVISMDNDTGRSPLMMQEMCKHAVDRSQGQLVDITICDFADAELLEYIADRSSQLRRLEFACCYGKSYESWAESLEKFPLLEELSLCLTDISKDGIKTAGRCCPMLTTLKINYEPVYYLNDETAIVIGENLHELRHIELIGDPMSNTGLQVILDGCRHLESLDLRLCSFINLKGEFGRKCLQKIKCLKLPSDSLEDCPYIYGSDPMAGPVMIEEIVEWDDDDEDL